MAYIPATTMGLLKNPDPQTDGTDAAKVAGVGQLTGGPVETNRLPDTPQRSPEEKMEWMMRAREKEQQHLDSLVPEAPGVLQRGTAPIGQAPDMKSGLGYVDPDKSTVAGQLSTLLGSDSKYIKEARRRGEEQGASRGLLNAASTAGLSEREAIAAGLGVAAPDAATYAAAQGRQQEGDITGALEAAGYDAQGRLQSGRAADTSALSAQEAAQTERREALGQKYDASNIRLEGDIQKTLNDAGYESQEELQAAAQAGDVRAMRLAGQIQTSKDQADFLRERRIQDRNAEIQTSLDKLAISASEKELYTQMLGSLTNTTLGSVNAILQNIDITDVAGAMDVLEGFLGSTEMGKELYTPDISVSGRSGATGTYQPTQKPADQFNEADYLKYNPDVADAVAAGTYSSGRDHYNKYGKDEPRQW
jgi:hypothetical protein